MAGGGRRKRANKHKNRQPVKDHASNESPELADELTALSAIFQNDFNLISETPFTEFSITLQPYSGGIGSLVKNVSVELHVRCLSGYPYKPPKLQVKSKGGLTEESLQSLLSMLVDQASSISREGRVMIFNLVEAAQEFLSEHSGSNLLQEQQESQGSTSSVDSWVAASNTTTCSLQDIRAPPVYGVVDLFTELGDESYWKGESHQTKKNTLQNNVGSSIASLGKRDPLAIGYRDLPEKVYKYGEFGTLALQGKNKRSDKYLYSEIGSQDIKPQVGQLAAVKLTSFDEKEENVGICTPKAVQLSSVSELLQKLYNGVYSASFKNSFPMEQGIQQPVPAKIEQEARETLSFDPQHFTFEDESDKSVHKDFILAQLLRLICCPRGPLPHALPALASQLQKLGIIPHWATNLVMSQPQLFDLAFHRIFADCIRETNVSSGGHAVSKGFWNASSEMLGEGGSAPARVTSRYSSDFEELSLLGRGGFGYVVLCRNNLDGRHYAMKKIRLKDQNTSLNNKILREVATLSRLQHHHIVRYYQAWFETVLDVMNFGSDLETSGEWILSGIMDKAESSFKSLLPKGMTIDDIDEKLVETTYLYIQMEYCPRTLREILDSNTEPMDEATAWAIFRQIVEGLAHIHRQGIIHRDLTPSNIFFDVRNDIKIGDFGLAKFANLEQTDKEPLTTPDQNGSLDGTGQVGTYFYTAPEVEQGWPHIDEKVDMYSLGVILFELWHPFSTAMERHIVLSELKNKGVLSSWAVKFPQQAVLVQSLMVPNPADRPSAMHVLRNNLPPRMEDEALDDVLRTIQRADHSHITDQIIAALFDEERISLMEQKLNREQLNCGSVEKTFFEDQILGIVKDVCTSHGAHRFTSHNLSLVDDGCLSHRSHSVRMIDSAGRMLELRAETRMRFARWVAANQVTSTKRFEISKVYRKAAGPSAPEEYYQGDFDIIGETCGLAEAEAIKVAVDILSKSGITDSYEICINHANILDAIWLWSGVKKNERKDVAKLLSSVGCAPPQSSERKSRWVHIRRQLVQGLQLTENVVDRLQTVELRWSGSPDKALSRLRGGLADSALICSAIDELSAIQSYLRVWSIGQCVYVDALMAPVEEYYRGVFFQVHIPKGKCHATLSSGMLLAVGGRYDHLVQQFWTSSLALPAPGAVGFSIALEKLILATASESIETETGAEVLVCSKGGGGLLRERMEVVSELWEGNIKAEFVHSPSPSLTEQYEYAHEHGIKWLVIITEAGLDHANSVKVRHMELRLEKDICRTNLVRFFMDMPAAATNIRRQAFLSEGN